MELDCESFTSALYSLSGLFSCEEGELKRVLLNLNIEKVYQDSWRSLEASEDYLYEYAIDNLGLNQKLSSVCWFHLSRTLQSNEYKEGILPLNQVLDDIWSNLVDFAPNLEVAKRLKDLNKSVLDFQYNLKTSDSLHLGPYAVLVRDVAFNADKLSQHDYLRMPEIIEDICSSYKEVYLEDISDHYESILKPKIVKFYSDSRLDDGCIKAALFYVYRKLHRQPICTGSVTCFDGESRPIPYNQIIKVEHL